MYNVIDKKPLFMPSFFLSYCHTALYIPVIASIAAIILHSLNKDSLESRKNFIMRSVLGSIGLGPILAIIDLFATCIRKIQKSAPSSSSTPASQTTPSDFSRSTPASKAAPSDLSPSTPINKTVFSDPSSSTPAAPSSSAAISLFHQLKLPKKARPILRQKRKILHNQQNKGSQALAYLRQLCHQLANDLSQEVTLNDPLNTDQRANGSSPTDFANKSADECIAIIKAALKQKNQLISSLQKAMRPT